MKLYSKKLNSIHDLRREMSVMRYAQKHSQKLIPDIETPFKHSKSDDDSKASVQSGLLAMVSGLLGKKGIASMLSSGLPLLNILPKKTRNNFLRRTIGQVLLGFFRWKAIELSLKSLKYIIRSRKEKRQERRNEWVNPNITKLGRA